MKKESTTRKLRTHTVRKQQIVCVITLPPDLVQKLEEDYGRSLRGTAMRLEHTAELSAKNLLPKCYTGAILITPKPE